MRGLFLVLLLAAVSAALGLRIADDLQRPPETLAPVETGGTVPDRTVEIPEIPTYDPPPIELFAEALARPLFSASRRPPETFDFGDRPDGVRNGTGAG